MFMPEEIFKLALSQGLLAVLFVWLFFDSRKESKEREERQRVENEKREGKYQAVIEKNQEVIEEQAKAFGSLSKDVTEIKQILNTKEEK
ncbi:bacteriocin biosynthesis protein [Bacillus wiedmannii]|uniref:BhlA/UviB family holin-like peptide n=1 Tax=Bacillus wiedmannii TaxID=1890302 RepID=UPI000BEE05CB|nr:BhlA/UviB family holin-like peptide [Bacillus wiedmannii]PEC58467.1 bacteriocin biosynthesis protein [Bacillus wiedmannii]PEI34238.1 bacteriocin biosynthesis protein [Bacillus wiedmannii]PEN91863.1 bacteriocin biosynthesis protein [Bacillus wiedmannii]